MSESEYIHYLQMPSVSAGAVLQHILRRHQMKKQEVARMAEILPQRLSDLISGARRFTPTLSLQLEHVLQIPSPGFFYIIQCRHDVYEAARPIDHPEPDLAVLTPCTFFDVDIQSVDWVKNRDWVIRRVLEYGTPAELREMARFYGRKPMQEMASHTELFTLPQRVQSNIQLIS